MKELEEILNTKIDTNINDLKAEESGSTNKTFSPLNSNNYPSYYNQHSADTNKWTLFKSPDFNSHYSHLTKHLSPMTLDYNTLLQILKWWDAIFLTSENLYQQTKYGHHTINTKHKITISLYLSSNKTVIINMSQQKKILKHYQENS